MANIKTLRVLAIEVIEQSLRTTLKWDLDSVTGESKH